LTAVPAFLAFSAYSIFCSPYGKLRTIETVLVLPTHGIPLMEIIGADYRIAEQRLNYEAASEILAPSTLKGRSITAARGEG